MIPIEIGPPRPHGPVVAQEGFRLFFFGATVWAVLGMIAWWMVYAWGLAAPRAELAGMQWHAHAMVFGFAAAAVAGFLLTAVRNWTGRSTLSGPVLMVCFGAWAIARLGMMIQTMPLLVPAIADLLFGTGLLAAILRPIAAAGQVRKQGGILSQVALLVLGNALFFAGLAGWLDDGVRWGLYLGFYSVLGLVLEVGRRILPNFIANGVGHPAELRNSRVVDTAALSLYVVFVVTEVFAGWTEATAVAAIGLAVVHGIRMAGWHDVGIWRRPLLWVLYLSYGWIVAGFALIALGPFHVTPPLAGLHALAVGGIALMAAGMMARVSLAHSGRSIVDLPRGTALAFALLVVAVVLRVLPPILYPSLSKTWIALSQVVWIVGFLLLAVRFAPVWFSRRAR